MSAKHTLENMVRNTWLAGLGSIESSVEALSKSFDAAQEKSNNMYNELLTRGEEIQSKINDTKVDIEARGKNLIGIVSGESHQEKLAKLNATIDHLTTDVVKLIEKHNAAASATKQAKIANKIAPKSAVKTTSQVKPAVTKNKVTKLASAATLKKEP
jgi:hypothetical protein